MKILENSVEEYGSQVKEIEELAIVTMIDGNNGSRIWDIVISDGMVVVAALMPRRKVSVAVFTCWPSVGRELETK